MQDGSRNMPGQQSVLSSMIINESLLWLYFILYMYVQFYSGGGSKIPFRSGSAQLICQSRVLDNLNKTLLQQIHVILNLKTSRQMELICLVVTEC